MTTKYLVHPLDSCTERVRRADEHLADLKAAFDAIFVLQANSIGIEFDPKPPYHLVKVSRPKETFFGMSIAILIGEICYNLRSALDYLVFELAKLDSGSEQNGTQFPIEDTVKGFRHRIKRGWLNGINSTHVAAIERLQPYNGCQWTKNLRDASNPDKHRHFVKAGGNFVATVHSSLQIDLSRVVGHARTETHPVIGPVNVKVHMAGSIAFADKTPVIETLEEIKTQIANTLIEFKTEF